MSVAQSMVQLDPRLIDNLVKEHLTAAVIGVLSEKKELLIANMVNQVLNVRCNQNGEVSSYSSDNKYSWIEMTLMKEMRGVIKDACIAQLRAIQPDIDKAIKKEVAKSGGAIAKAIMAGFTEALKIDYNFKINIAGQ